jgi:tetratricopeptide (TPR) repeat protein
MQAAKLAGPATLSASGALLFVSLFFGDGISDGRLFWLGAFAVLAVGVVVVTAALPVPRGPGLACLILLAALTAWIGLSMAWSVAPDRSWAAFDRILVYGAFALLGLAAAAAPRPARTVGAGLAALVALVLVWALAGKVVPALFPGGARVARLRNPIGYWNSLALVAAIAVPLALWLASSRRHARWLRAAGAVVLYLAELVVVLTYSRGGIAVALLAALAWVAFAEDRLESLAAVLVATPPAALVALWAFSRPALTDDLQPYASRVHDGAWFGVFLCVGAAVVGTIAYAASRVQVPAELRGAYTRRAGALLAGVAVIALAVVLVARGGTILDEFRGTHGQISQGKTRFAELSSSNRWTWWKEAWTLFERAPLEGKGAATFEIARRDIRNSAIVTTEPHDLPLQFLSETGAIGFLLLLGLGAAGALAVRSALRRLESAERAAATALAVGVAAYAVHVLIDIHWEFVAVSAPAFFALGLLVGLGAERRSRRPAVALATGVAAGAVLYSLAAPYASSRLVDSTYSAIADGRIDQALSDGRTARWLNPLAIDPLVALGDTESERRAEAIERGDEAAARRADTAALRRYRQAVSRQPENSSTWFALGSFEYFTGRYRAALHDLDRAYGLDPWGPAGRRGGLLDQARAKVEGR